jgi:hypothetical protein
MNRTRRAPAIVATLTLALAATVAAPVWGADPSPAIGSLSLTGSLDQARQWHTATLLPDGRVLVARGLDTVDGDGQALGTAELWDPATGSFIRQDRWARHAPRTPPPS